MVFAIIDIQHENAFKRGMLELIEGHAPSISFRVEILFASANITIVSSTIYCLLVLVLFQLSSYEV